MKTKLFLLIAILVVSPKFYSQETPQKPVNYEFTKIKELPATPVKNQASSGTCWSYATASFLESEILRAGKGEFDLSEMYIVRANYLARMDDNYLRRGKGNLGEGSIAHNYVNLVAKEGIVPQEVYNGINYDSKLNNHGELNKFINKISEVAIELRRRSPEYYKLVNSLFDIYLGPIPEKFTYKGKEYTPKTFAASLGLNYSDYVEITSFTHAPFYTMFAPEIPDNWDFGKMYNVPLEDLMAIADNSINTGYTFCWDGDVSEKGFSHQNGVAVLLSNPANPASEEITATQENRQKGFENFTTTDDHLMHMTGIAKDQNGKKYYITKNSWGTERNNYGGYLYISENYFKAKCISIMVNKNAIPKEIRTKLGL